MNELEILIVFAICFIGFFIFFGCMFLYIGFQIVNAINNIVKFWDDEDDEFF